MTSSQFFEWSFTFTPQSPYGGETLDTTAPSSSHPHFPPLQQHPTTYKHTYNNNMLLLQHDTHQQAQPAMAPQIFLGYADMSTAFTAPMENMWQGYSDLDAPMFNGADYNSSPYQQQPPTMTPPMPSGYTQQAMSAMAPMNNSWMPSFSPGTAPYNRATNNAVPHLQQQPAMISRKSPGQPRQHAPATPPQQVQRSAMTPRRPSIYTQQLPQAPALSPHVRQQPTPPAPTLKNSPHGLKRSADDNTLMPTAKRQAATVQSGMGTPNIQQAPQFHLPVSSSELVDINNKLQNVKRMHGEAAYLRACAEVRGQWERSKAAIKQKADRAAKLKRAEQEKAAEAHRLEQEKDKAARLEWQKAQVRRTEESRRQQAQQAQQAILDAEFKKREEAAQKAREAAEAEEFRITQEEAIKRERKAIRKEHLRADRGSLYHSYYEFLEYFPLREGESKNQYCMSLLANRRLFNAQPGEDNYESIMYAKENWEMYLSNTLADQKLALKLAKEKMAKLAAGDEVARRRAMFCI
jgi:hypothetical protein